MRRRRKGGKIYLHLLEKASGPVTLPGLPVPIQSAKLLHGASIKTSTNDGILSLDIPESAWNEIDTIVELTIAGDSMDIAPLNASTGSGVPGAKASASVIYGNDNQYAAEMAIDGDPETRWATPEGTQQSWLQIDLPKQATISGIEIDEAFANPQSRVTKYELQTKDGNSWTTIHSGSALGEHFKTSFKSISSKAIRLNILDATNGPTISEVRLNTKTP